MPAIFAHPPFLAALEQGSTPSASLTRVAPVLVESTDLTALNALAASNAEYWVSLQDGASVDQAIQVLDGGASKLVIRDAELVRDGSLPAERVILKIDSTTSAPLSSDSSLVQSIAGVLVELPDAQDQQAQLLASFREALGGKSSRDSKLLFFIPPSSASIDEVATMAQLDARAVPCMSTSRLDPSSAAHIFTAALRTDRPDGLFATLVASNNGEPLGMVYSSTASLALSIQSGDATYYSRSRNSLWKKGETSGATQRVNRIRFDCDADAVQFEVEQKSGTGFCQYVSPTRSCRPSEQLTLLASAIPTALYARRHASDTRRVSPPSRRPSDRALPPLPLARIPHDCSRTRRC